MDPNELTPIAPGPSAYAQLEHRDRVTMLRQRSTRCRPRCAPRLCCATSTNSTYHEIATELRLPEGTVKSRINRGRTRAARHIRRLRDQQDAARKSWSYSHEPDHREKPGRRHRARQRGAPDVSPAAGLLLAPSRRPSPLEQAGAGPDQRDLCGQRHDRLPDGSVSPGHSRWRGAEAGRGAEARRNHAVDDRAAQFPRNPRRRSRLPFASFGG